MPTIKVSPAVPQDFEIFETNTLVFELDFLNDDNSVLNISAWSFVLDMKLPYGQFDCHGVLIPNTSQVLTIGKGLSITAPNKLFCNANITLIHGNYIHNLTGTDSAGIVRTVMYGQIQVDQLV